jgi:hypothetical protein
VLDAVVVVVAAIGGVLSLAVGEDEASNRAGKKRPQPQGLGSRSTSVVRCREEIMTKFMTNPCCIAKIKKLASFFVPSVADWRRRKERIETLWAIGRFP